MVDATSLFDNPPSYQDEYYDAIALPEISKISISQSVQVCDQFSFSHLMVCCVLTLVQSLQAPLTTSHTATISGSIESKNGRGRGGLTMSLRQIISPLMWGEVCLGQ